MNKYQTFMPLVPTPPLMRVRTSKPLLRAAAEADVPTLAAFIAQYARQGHLLPRSTMEIHRSLPFFKVATVDGTIIGCCSLRQMRHDRMELRSLAVAEPYRNQGIAARLVQALIQQAWRADASAVFALTRSVTFFTRLGFRVIDKAQLPEKTRRDCVSCLLRDYCDEEAVILYRPSNYHPYIH